LSIKKAGREEIPPLETPYLFVVAFNWITLLPAAAVAPRAYVGFRASKGFVLVVVLIPLRRESRFVRLLGVLVCHDFVLFCFGFLSWDGEATNTGVFWTLTDEPEFRSPPHFPSHYSTDSERCKNYF
jgi:hypothetical protein